MKIWRLTSNHAEPAFPYITSEEEANDYLDLFSHKFYNKETISAYWPPTLICNLKEADIGWLSFAEQEFWIFTEKARELLEPLLEEKVEFLPLIHRKKAHLKIPRMQQIMARKAYRPLLDIIHPEAHYLLNILDIKPLSLIDFDQSDFEYNEEKQEIFMTESLAFYPEMMENVHLFKIMNHGKALQRATFISDEFKTIVEENKLTGLKFSEEHEDEGGNLIWTKK